MALESHPQIPPLIPLALPVVAEEPDPQRRASPWRLIPQLLQELPQAPLHRPLRHLTAGRLHGEAMPGGLAEDALHSRALAGLLSRPVRS